MDASNTAGGSSTILVGPGTFSDSFTNITGASSIAITGAGAGQTVLQSTLMDELDDPGSSVSGVTIVVPDATNAVGVTLTAGTMSASAITDAGDAHSSLTAVELNGPATLSHSSVTLADSDSSGIVDFGAMSGVATVADTRINGSGANATGVEVVSATETDFLRDRIVAAAPVEVFGGGAITRLDDSLIEGTDTTYSIEGQSGAAGTTTTLLVDHDTLTGATAAAPGIAALPGSDATGTVAVTVRNTIIQTGGFTNLDVPAPSVGDPGAATLSISYSDYNPAEASDPSAAITTGDGNIDVDPGFAGSGPDPFALTSSSSLLDQGDPAGVESGETSTTDLLGAPRVLAAGGGCTARTDIGAYELNRTTIATTVKPAAASVRAGSPLGFSASPCDPDPTQTLTVSWTFDDGGSASGTSVTHTFATLGMHTATVHVTDPAGRTGTATTTITVTQPACSGASCNPRAPVLRLRGGPVHLSRTRSAALALTCIATAPCQGTLTLHAVITRFQHHKREHVKITLATVRFTIRARATATVKLTISRADAALLVTLRKLKATATIVAHDGSSSTTTSTARVTLEPPKKREHGLMERRLGSG